MNNFHQKVVQKLIEADDGLYEDRATADAMADKIDELCKEEFKVTEDTSDGYHTFKELYDHRIILFIALMQSHPKMSWRSHEHSDGSSMDGWFVAGMDLPKVGQITYHLPLLDWSKLEGIKVLEKAPEYDGHSPQDVVNRLEAWIATL